MKNRSLNHLKKLLYIILFSSFIVFQNSNISFAEKSFNNNEKYTIIDNELQNLSSIKNQNTKSQPYLEISLSSNNINFNVTYFNKEINKDLNIAVSSSTNYKISSSGTDFKFEDSIIPISNLSLSIDNSEYTSLSYDTLDILNNISSNTNMQHNLDFKLIVPEKIKAGKYIGSINIIVSNIVEDNTVDKTKSFEITYKTTTTNESVELSLPQKGDTTSGYEDYEYKYNFEVDWGDGTSSQITSWDDIDKTHLYKEPGNYKVSINGLMEGWDIYDDDNDLMLGTYKKIIEINQWGETNLKYISFYSSSNIISNIPNPTKKSFENIKSFSYIFYGCSGLSGSIPENLFANSPNVTNFGSTFLGCRGLSGSIPENLFTNNPNVTSFFNTFLNCSGLSGSIPENLFANNPNVTSFGSTFERCSGLSGSIPENLFANNPNVTSFGSTFKGCSGLSGSIPENLFANSPNVTSFLGTFWDCSGLNGNAPKLWESHTKVTNSSSCFKNCVNLSNYNKIPKDWKQ